MAGTDHQKQLLSLIRDFAAEKSQGERRIAALKKQQQELRSELDMANAKLEEAKCCRETAEQELKGYEVELAMNKSAVQSLQARVCTTQDQMSAVNIDIEDLKKEASSRDEFINKMFEMNDSIRKFMLTMSGHLTEDDTEEVTIEDSEVGDQIMEEEMESIPGISLEDKLNYVVSQTEIEEKMLKAEQDLNKQLQQECIDLEKHVLMMEAVANETTDS
ncbi:uncharacterized protein LOC116215386 isoform X2 [Punica granatum]|uniref:Uncharacterized protein LOC116215386 isoform X2 n=1 Tax=Punica granatum TaxID=22663 RepID=A0A6P8EJR7_PUNGR|nr:uncharacterized protein LOC116215386 isoform X2 [Punica granatum]